MEKRRREKEAAEREKLMEKQKFNDEKVGVSFLSPNSQVSSISQPSRSPNLCSSLSPPSPYLLPSSSPSLDNSDPPLFFSSPILSSSQSTSTTSLSSDHGRKNSDLKESLLNDLGMSASNSEFLSSDIPSLTSSEIPSEITELRGALDSLIYLDTLSYTMTLDHNISEESGESTITKSDVFLELKDSQSDSAGVSKSADQNDGQNGLGKEEQSTCTTKQNSYESELLHSSDLYKSSSHASKSRSTSDVSGMTVLKTLTTESYSDAKIPIPPSVIFTSPTKEKHKAERQKEKKGKRRPNITLVMFGDNAKELKEASSSTSSVLDKSKSDVTPEIHDKKLLARSRSVTLDVESVLSPLLNLRDLQLRTALHCACMTSAHSVSLVSTLVDNGALKSPVDIRGRTPLFYAAFSQNLLILSYLLELLGREEQMKADEFGFTPLHVTCGKGWVQGKFIFEIVY